MSAKRSEHSLTHSKHWPDYLGGILTEAGFILALTAIAYLLAMVAKVIWR